MLATNRKNSLLSLLVIGSCSALFTLAALDAHAITQEKGCLFTRQLASDPAVRAEFSQKLAALAAHGPEEGAADDSDLYSTDIDAAGFWREDILRNTGGADRLSNDCLSCHDGVMAQNFPTRIKNNPSNRVMELNDIIGGHPVGMEYDNYVAHSGKNYKREARFSKRMVFVDGKVGCLTCHNPLNLKKGHLVMNNDRSELCFACHSK
jgi:predicted CXXCH cytochrome family protein